jgi:GlcNAc-P-P-Und epimerase
MISIIGGSGFIGTKLSSALTESAVRFNILDINKSLSYPEKFLFTDVRDLNILTENLQDSEIIINLAAEHKDNVTPVSLYDEVNVAGARNVCIAAERLGIKKIIFTSSVAVYGFPEKETDESGKINYFNDYGRTKYMAEQVYLDWYNNDPEKSLIIIRPTVVFGPGNRGNVYNLLSQIASGQFIMVGDGQNKKSIVYIDNVVALIMKCLDLNGYYLTNVVDTPDFSMNELVELVNQTMGRKKSISIRLPYVLGLFAGSGFDLLSLITGKKFSISKVRVKKFCSSTQFVSGGYNKIGFTPPVKLENALRETIQIEFLKK